MENMYPERQPMNALTHYSDPAAIAAAEAAKARIQSAYIMALQKPRNEMEARDRILTACRRSEFAGRAEFAKPIGKTTVKGPSIRFAELALREWGNIMTEVQVLYEDIELRRVRVSALDLETNTQFTKDIQIKRTIERKNKKGREDDIISERKNVYGDTVYILRATDEEMHTKESAWVSKVLRNEGLRLIPTDIIEEGMSESRKTIAMAVGQDPEGEKKKLLDSFSTLGIKPKDLEKYIKHGINTISPAELIRLRTVYQSIRDGETTWADYEQEFKAESELEKYDTTEFDGLVKHAISGAPLGPLREFIKLTADSLGVTEDQLKHEAAKDFAGFWNQFKIWREKHYKKDPGGHPGKYGPDEITPGDRDPTLEKNWKSKRYSDDPALGLHGYIMSHREAFLDAPGDVLFNLEAKYRKDYLEQERPVSHPWPLQLEAQEPRVFLVLPEEKQVEQDQENGSTTDDEKELEAVKAQFADWKKDQPRIVAMAKGRSDLECNAKLDMDEWSVADYLEIIEKIGVLYRLENGGEEKF